MNLKDKLNCPFDDGQLISCYIGSPAQYVAEGRIHYGSNAVYICQNVLYGSPSCEKCGYKYTWYACDGRSEWSKGCSQNNVKNCVALDTNTKSMASEEVKKIKFSGNVVTRAVKQNDSTILLELGLTLAELADKVKDDDCLFRLKGSSQCVGLICHSDDCPFYSGLGNDEGSARRWILGPKDISELKPSILPEPHVNIIANKKDFFKEQEDISLENLLNSV